MANYMALNKYLVKAERNCWGYVGGGAEKKHSAIGSKVKHATGTFWYGTYLATMVIGFLFRSPKIIRYLSIGSNTYL